MTDHPHHKTLPQILTLWTPGIFLIITVLLEYNLDTKTASRLLSENGPYEIAQFFIISLACLIAVTNVFFFKKKSKPLLVGWNIIAALCCLYVAGEEVSWGQHFFDWATPENWSERNDQNETNFHNTTSWLDQKPRLILLLGIIVGGIVIPLIQIKRALSLPKYISQLIPSKELMFIALCVVIPQIVEKLGEAANILVFTRFSEVQELYMFYFILLYLISLRRMKLS